MSMPTTIAGTPGRETGGFRVPQRLGFAVVIILWLAFGAALAADPGILDSLWRSIRGLWVPIQVVVWVLLLPWVIGLWVWQMPWMLWLRLLLVAGLAMANVAAFFPRRAHAAEATVER